MNNFGLVLQSLVLLPDLFLAGLRVMPIVIQDAWQQRKEETIHWDGD